MFEVRVATSVFTDKLNEYRRLTGKGLSETLREQALLLAQRLTKLTFPASASQGKKAVERDIGRVYLRNEWLHDVFQFTKKKLGDRIKKLIDARDSGALSLIFQKTSRLRMVHIESFDRSRHAKMRRNGRVLVPNPNSFPVAQQSKVKALINEKKRNVGTAKAGWAQCAALLGKGQPAWLNKTGTGSVIDASSEPEHPHVTLTNNVPWFASLDERASIVERALEGRAVAMVKSAERQLALAAKAAGF